MKIYVVTSGEYSDYHIEGVYESRELAQEVCGADCEMEEWEMNTDLTEHRQGLERYMVMMLRDGTLHYTGKWWRDNQKPQDTPPTDYRQVDKGTTLSIATFEMWAKDREHAIKIANERRTQLIAENKWPPI